MQDMKLKDQIARYEMQDMKMQVMKRRTMLDAQFVQLAVDPELKKEERVLYCRIVATATAVPSAQRKCTWAHCSN